MRIPFSNGRNSAFIRVSTLMIVALLAATPALASPTLVISETTVQPGQAVWMTIEGFVPGGYDGTIIIDDVAIQDIEIYPGGSRTFAWIIPEDLSIGGHDIYICAACNQGDLEEQTNIVRLTVISGDLTGSQFNLQPWGMEVTQGVRADFATRTPPGAGPDLPGESITHVANRRTIVRVYPWVEGGPDFTRTTNVKAQLWVTRDGTTYGPIAPTSDTGIEVRADGTMEALRSDIQRTWNFVLPPEAAALSSTQTSGSFDLRVEINPPGPGQKNECDTCFDDNTITLDGNAFRHVGRSNRYALKFRPHLVESNIEQEDGSSVFVPRPTIGQMIGAVRSLYDVLPIADGNRGVRLMPWRNVDWDGTQEEWDPVQDDFLIANYLPGGTLHSAPPNDYYAFMYWGGGRCSGHAFRYTPFLRTSACSAPPYVAAHELNHAIGAAHAGNYHGEAAGGGYDPSYPGYHGQVEEDTWGLDVYSLRLHPPRNPVTESDAHDFMSYGGTDEWVSRYTWNLSAENLGAPDIDPGKRSVPFPLATPDKAEDLDHVAFRGRLMPGSGLELAPFFSTYTPDGNQGDGAFQLDFTDANGALLSSISPRVLVAQDAPDFGTMFAEAIALPVGWNTMTLHEGNDLVGSWARSPNPPQATITSPAEGFDWPNTGPVTVTWNGSDPDGGSLIYRLMALHETDNEVFTLAAELTGESYILDLATLPGGGDWTLLVEVSDGLNRASSPTVSGTVAPTNPQVMILEPADGSVHVAGTNVPAVGLAADLQGEIANGDVNWYLDGFWVGSGTAFDLQDVAAGSHQLKLEVYNQYQLAGISTVQFDVVSELQPPVQVSPADGATLVPRPVVMTWVAVPGAISYRVQVSYSPNFVGEVGEAGNITGTEVSFDPPAGEQPVYWRVMAEHGSAPSTWSPTRWFTPGNQASPVEDLPTLVELDLTVYPNPFNPSTTISFDLPQNGLVTVEVFDLAGHRVRALSRGHLQAGQHQMTWNGRDQQGRAVGSGVYLVRLVTPQGTRSQRALLLK